jgi:hypothetical protein
MENNKQINTKTIKMKLQHLLIATVLFTACKNEKSKEEKVQTESNTTTTSSSTTTTPTPADDGKGGRVSFKVNDSLARTAKGTHSNDRDEHIGMYTESTNYFSLSLMGDVSNRPHRGWVNFSIKGFKFEPASYLVSKDNHVSFSRYETENAGGETSYEASGLDVFKGTEMNLTISKVIPDPASFNGRDWLASGTFSAKMLIKENNPYKRTSNEGVTLSEGTFENVRIAGGPKHK